MTTPLDAIKLKINGVCMNKCKFCQFHNSLDRLSVFDLKKFFNKIDSRNYNRFRRIIINGGEPTLHPDFIKINDLLRSLFRNKKRLEIGTNLRLFEVNNIHTRKILESIYSTYQRIQVGCDDEHKNIDIVEKLIPEFCRRNIKMAINSIDGYYSKETKLRLLKISKAFGIKLFFSPLAHMWQKKPFIGHESLCKKRREDFLVDCNGNAYFCYQQELEKPIFNIHKTSKSDFNYFLFDYIPEKKYKFCDYCEKFQKDSNEQL